MKNRGLLYAAISSLFLSTGFIFAKHFLSMTNPETLNVLWFGIAFLLSAAILLARNAKKTISMFALHWKDGMIVGGANALAASFWFHSVNTFGPTPTAFVTRISTIFIILLGVLLLKEKLHLHDILGLAIAGAGAFLITYSGGDYFSTGALLALAASLAIAIHQVISKIYVKSIDPLMLVSIRTLYTCLYLLLYAVISGKLHQFPLSEVPLLTLAIGINALVGFLFFYKALEIMDVSKVAITRTMDPFIVVILALAVFHTIPSHNQLIGGTLIIIGVITTMYGHTLPTLLRTVKGLPWFG